MAVLHGRRFFLQPLLFHVVLLKRSPAVVPLFSQSNRGNIFLFSTIQEEYFEVKTTEIPGTASEGRQRILPFLLSAAERSALPAPIAAGCGNSPTAPCFAMQRGI